MAERVTLERLNALSHDDATAAFTKCCASRLWAREMAARRPYRDMAALLDMADRVWHELGEPAWREAFDGHPRIGEQRAAAPTGETERSWSKDEQSGVLGAEAAVRAQLAAAQQDYERRFGHIFLICASGLTAEDMLAALHARAGNDPDTELRVAAEEQRRIARLRLEKLLTS